jgi:hypothetical protein
VAARIFAAAVQKTNRVEILAQASRFRGVSFVSSLTQKTSMNYAMLVYLDAERWEKLSKDERNRVHAECGTWHEELVKSGRSRSAVGLQPISTATTLSEKDGRVIISDGPFAETKEILGGFELVECQDLDEAIAIGKRFPALRVGSRLEVRPLVTGPCVD